MNNFKTCLNEHYVYCNGIIYKELKEALTTIAEENSKEHKDIIMLKINNYRGSVSKMRIYNAKQFLML